MESAANVAESCCVRRMRCKNERMLFDVVGECQPWRAKIERFGVRFDIEQSQIDKAREELLFVEQKSQNARTSTHIDYTETAHGEIEKMR